MHDIDCPLHASPEASDTSADTKPNPACRSCGMNQWGRDAEGAPVCATPGCEGPVQATEPTPCGCIDDSLCEDEGCRSRHKTTNLAFQCSDGCHLCRDCHTQVWDEAQRRERARIERIIEAHPFTDFDDRDDLLAAIRGGS
jgi:hypothetical protein